MRYQTENLVRRKMAINYNAWKGSEIPDRKPSQRKDGSNAWKVSEIPDRNPSQRKEGSNA